MAHTLRKANAGSFEPGNPGGPGRPIGARSKLTELATEMLREDFEKHGADVIRRVRERKPEVYLASVVSLLPKQAEKIQSPLVDISDDELEQLEQRLREVRAKTIKRKGLALLKDGQELVPPCRG
jgi:lipoate synthase